MKLVELLPELTGLDRSDKVRAMEFLASELKKEEPAETSEHVGDIDELQATEPALEFYRSVLQPTLEPTHSGESVAIHIDSKAYELAKRPGHAYRALRAKHPIGTIVVHRIGIADAGLAARMRGERHK